MRRQLGNTAVVVSLLLCLVTSAAWVRSFFVHDYCPVLIQHSGMQLQSVSGELVVNEAIVPSPVRGAVNLNVGISGSAPPDNPALAAQVRSLLANPASSRLASFRIIMPALALSNYFGLRFDHAVMSIGNGKSPLAIQVHLIPYWIIVVASLVLPTAVFLIRHSKRHRAIAGLCEKCGYDLRATPDRCPECGTVRPASAPERCQSDCSP